VTDRPIWGAEDDPDEPTQLGSVSDDPHGPSAWEEEEATEIVQATDIGGFFGERFRVDARLGVGAMGRVLTAVDTKTNTLVALKVLHKDRAKSPEVVERFQREAAVLRQIQHPAIVHLVAFDRARDGTWWLAMEHLQGKTLKDRIQQGGPFSPTAAWPVLATICDAVAVAHGQGILHRDLKPENVLLLESGLPPCKILDFGLSRYTTKPDRITATGAVLGTPRYMAPELLAEASSVDERADVFAIGVIAFEMLTGRSIYPAEDFAQLFGCILEGRTIPLRQVRPDASPELERVIAQAVAKDAAQRTRSADELASQLARALRVSPDRSVFLPKPGGATRPDPASGLREAPRQAAPAMAPVPRPAPAPSPPGRPAARTVLVGTSQGRIVDGGAAPAPMPAPMPAPTPAAVLPAHTPTSGIHVSRPSLSTEPQGTSIPRAVANPPALGAPQAFPQAPQVSPAAPQGFQPAPQGVQPAPQGFQPAPQGVQPAPQGFQPAPQGFQPAPQGFQPASQGFQPASQGFQPGPQGFQAAPQPAPQAPQAFPAGPPPASATGAFAASFTRPEAAAPSPPLPQPPASEGPSPRAIALWVGLFLVAAVVTMATAGALAYFLRTWLATH
jgi:serine/threonine-protein kinase